MKSCSLLAAASDAIRQQVVFQAPSSHPFGLRCAPSKADSSVQPQLDTGPSRPHLRACSPPRRQTQPPLTGPQTQGILPLESLGAAPKAEDCLKPMVTAPQPRLQRAKDGKATISQGMDALWHPSRQAWPNSAWISPTLCFMLPPPWRNKHSEKDSAHSSRHPPRCRECRACLRSRSRLRETW